MTYSPVSTVEGHVRTASPHLNVLFLAALLIPTYEAVAQEPLFVPDTPLRLSCSVAQSMGTEFQITSATQPQPVPVEQSKSEDCPGAQERSHTGVQALIRTTAADFAAFPRRRSTWVILGVGAGAAAIFHQFDDDANSHLVTSDAVGKVWAPGSWVGAAYTQVGVSVGLYTIGRYVIPHVEGDPKTNKYSHLGFDLLRAQIVSQALVHGIKYTVRRDRPTGECCAFPSGHAATAFAAASVLERHLGHRAAWPTLLAAAYVGTSRLHDNRHFLSDVLFGSAVGVATGWTVVGRHGRSDFALAPVPVHGGIALALTRTY